LNVDNGLTAFLWKGDKKAVMITTEDSPGKGLKVYTSLTDTTRVTMALNTPFIPKPYVRGGVTYGHFKRVATGSSVFVPLASVESTTELAPEAVPIWTVPKATQILSASKPQFEGTSQLSSILVPAADKFVLFQYTLSGTLYNEVQTSPPPIDEDGTVFTRVDRVVQATALRQATKFEAVDSTCQDKAQISAGGTLNDGPYHLLHGVNCKAKCPAGTTTYGDFACSFRAMAGTSFCMSKYVESHYKASTEEVVRATFRLEFNQALKMPFRTGGDYDKVLKAMKAMFDVTRIRKLTAELITEWADIKTFRGSGDRRLQVRRLTAFDYKITVDVPVANETQKAQTIATANLPQEAYKVLANTLTSEGLAPITGALLQEPVKFTAPVFKDANGRVVAAQPRKVIDALQTTITTTKATTTKLTTKLTTKATTKPSTTTKAPTTTTKAPTTKSATTSSSTPKPTTKDTTTLTATIVCPVSQLNEGVYKIYKSGRWNCTSTTVHVGVVCRVVCLGQSYLRTANQADDAKLDRSKATIQDRHAATSVTCLSSTQFSQPKISMKDVYCVSDVRDDADNATSTAIVVGILAFMFLIMICTCAWCVVQRQRSVAGAEAAAEEQEADKNPPELDGV
jgi:hypothetical protein